MWPINALICANCTEQLHSGLLIDDWSLVKQVSAYVTMLHRYVGLDVMACAKLQHGLIIIIIHITATRFALWAQKRINSLKPRRCRRHFEDDIFKCIFLNEKILIPSKIPLKFIPKGPINNIPALVQIMAWCRPVDKPLCEPIMIISLMHICITQPQWVKWVTYIYRVHCCFFVIQWHLNLSWKLNLPTCCAIQICSYISDTGLNFNSISSHIT